MDCQYCLYPFTARIRPLTLPCAHIYCSQCIQFLQKKKKVICFCGSSFKNITNFPVNEAASQSIESYERKCKTHNQQFTHFHTLKYEPLCSRCLESPSFSNRTNLIPYADSNDYLLNEIKQKKALAKEFLDNYKQLQEKINELKSICEYGKEINLLVGKMDFEITKLSLAEKLEKIKEIKIFELVNSPLSEKISKLNPQKLITLLNTLRSK